MTEAYANLTFSIRVIIVAQRIALTFEIISI